MKTAAQVLTLLKKEGDPNRARHAYRYFKTAPGEYGEGDRFLGSTVPQLRALVKKTALLPLSEIGKLIRSEYHEARLLGFFTLVQLYEKGTPETRENIFNYVIREKAYLNNWDIVDAVAPKIIGPHLATRDKSLLKKLVRSRNLWDRRIGVIATMPHIKGGDIELTLQMGKTLLGDREDLMHKASGWMLREVGKVDGAALEKFLLQFHARMPRTMLRYAIEKLPHKKRRMYLKGTLPRSKH